MEGFAIGSRAHHVDGYSTALDGENQLNIVDDSDHPADNVERLLDLPDGESLNNEAVKGLAALFAALSHDLKGRNVERSLMRRVVSLGVQLGAIDCTLEEAGRAMNVTRQAVLQSGQGVLRKLSLVFEADDLKEHNRHVTGRPPTASGSPRKVCKHE